MRGTGCRPSSLLLVWCAALAAAPLLLRAQAPTPVRDLAHPQGTNAAIFAFTRRCARCHDSGSDGAPDRYALTRRTPEEVLEVLARGAHAEHAKDLDEFTRRVVAVYVGGRPLGAAATGDAERMPNRCAAGAAAFTPFSGSE